LQAATQADRPIRTLCSVLYYTGCRISEALALTARRIDITDQTIIFYLRNPQKTPQGRLQDRSRAGGAD
jgi:integrase